MLEGIFDAYGDPYDRFLADILKSIAQVEPLRTAAYAKLCEKRAKNADKKSIARAAKTWLPRSSRDEKWDPDEARDMLLKAPLHPLITMAKLPNEIPLSDVPAVLHKLQKKHVTAAIANVYGVKRIKDVEAADDYKVLLSKAGATELPTLLMARKFNYILYRSTSQIDFDSEWLAKHPGRKLPPYKILARFPELHAKWKSMTAIPYLFVLDAVLTENELVESDRMGGKLWKTFAGLAISAANQQAIERRKTQPSIEAQLAQIDTQIASGIVRNIR